MFVKKDKLGNPTTIIIFERMRNQIHIRVDMNMSVPVHIYSNLVT
jgi:hypothetical protein